MFTYTEKKGFVYNTISMECVKMCSALAERIQNRTIAASLHSLFARTANLSTPFGLVTVLKEGRALQPYSLMVSQDFDPELLRDGELCFSDGSLISGNRELIRCKNAEACDLSLREEHAPLPENRKLLEGFLSGKRDQGIVGLAFGEAEDIYSRFLTPRIGTLREKAKLAAEDPQETEAFLEAVWNCAGCGPGLTPSSDDFLSGYLLYFPERRNDGIRKKAAFRAALRTNDISAALLRHGGERMYAEDILQFYGCMGKKCPEKEIVHAIERVSEFGSSSGCDFLTGAFLSMIDFYKLTEESK